jgi:PTS system mannose-specific IIA component
MLKQNHSGMEIVTGVNVPMLLQLFIQREQLSLTELVSSVIEAGVDGIYRYEMPTENEDEEF